MSEVAAHGLAQALEEYSFAYLMTVTTDGRPHAVAVEPRLGGELLRIDGLGRRSRGNAEERPRVSLVWPPSEIGGYSLIVDGEAVLDGDSLQLSPTRAVRHRPHGMGEEGAAGACASDCLPIDLGVDG